MKINTALLFPLLFLLVCCKANDTISKLEKKADADILSPSGLKKEVNQTHINQSLSEISDVTKDSLLSELKVKNITKLEDYYNASYIDSLRNILYQKKELKIKKNEDFLLNFLTEEEGVDTLVLAYLNVPSPSNGVTNSYSYDVLEGDHIFYEVNTGKRGINNISFLLGEEVRVKFSKLKKNTTKSGSFRVLSDNKLTLNLSNNGILKNFGLFRSQLTIKLKKTVPNKGTKIEFVNDTVYVNKSRVETTKDTIYKISDTKSVVLSPTLDITQNSSLTFPIVIPDVKNLLGWGYWIGTNTKEFESYQSLKDSVEAGIIFAREELNNLEPSIKLPEASNNEVSLLILNQSLDARSFHYNKNFAFYKTDSLILKGNKKATVKLTNHSTIYNSEINYRLFTAREIKRERKVVKLNPVIKKSILVKLN